MKYFTLEELYKSDMAVRLGIQNMPSDKEKGTVEFNLQYLVRTILDPLRAYMKVPVLVLSGYRCPELNAKIDGVYDSSHTRGEAADITIQGASREDIIRMVRFIECNCDYDQMIVYRSLKFIHVSTRLIGNRRAIIVK